MFFHLFHLLSLVLGSQVGQWICFLCIYVVGMVELEQKLLKHPQLIVLIGFLGCLLLICNFLLRCGIHCLNVWSHSLRVPVERWLHTLVCRLYISRVGVVIGLFPGLRCLAILEVSEPIHFGLLFLWCIGVLMANVWVPAGCFFLVMDSPGLGFEVEVEVLGRFRFVESGDSTKGGCLGLPLGENPSSCSYSRRYQNPSPLFWIYCGP